MEKNLLTIIGNGMNGEGIAKQDGKVYFVDGAVEGDVVLCEIVKENKNFDTAKVCELIQESVYRCVPKCKHYSDCGGCNLQHIQYQKQLEIKTQNVQNLFDKQKFGVKVKSCLPSDKQLEYRNKLTLYTTKDNNLGFYEKSTNNLVNIDSCCLVDETFNALISKLNKFLKLNKEYGCVVKGFAIRQAGGCFVINAILNKKISLTKLENCLKLNKISYSLYYCINSKTNLPTYPCCFVGGNKSVYIEEAGIKYPVHPLAFMQVNNSVKRKIYDDILNLISSKDVVLDAYSGSGLLSSLLAKNGRKAYAVEIDKSASDSCVELCKINSIKNVECINGDCASYIAKILEKTKVDAVVLDPARKGVDKNSLTAICLHQIPQVVYLSCNPATLARDLRVLCDSGYKIECAQPYDMFPNTSEVETLVSLKRV